MPGRPLPCLTVDDVKAIAESGPAAADRVMARERLSDESLRAVLKVFATCDFARAEVRTLAEASLAALPARTSLLR